MEWLSVTFLHVIDIDAVTSTTHVACLMKRIHAIVRLQQQHVRYSL